MCENHNIKPICNSRNENVKKIFGVLIQEDAKFRELNQNKVPNVSLILGNFGAGKSVFTRWISGNDANLIAEKDKLNPAVYKINNPTNASSTILPELIMDKETGAAYYDFPGFKDNVGVANDIAISYYIKKTMDRVERIKIILVVKYSSVTSDADIQDFTTLITFVSKFITNIDKLKNSIALIAARVRDGGESDDSITDGIILFINTIKGLFEEYKTKQKMEYTNEIKLMNILMSKEGDHYPKIGLFRAPNKTGPLSNITLLQDNKKNITKMLSKLNFTETKNFDFSYALPKHRISDIIDAKEEMRKGVIQNIRKICDEIQIYFSNKEKILNETVSHTNILNVYHDMKLGYDNWYSVRESAFKSSTPRHCVQQIINAVNGYADVQNDVIKQSSLTALDFSDSLEFLKIFNDNSANDEIVCAVGLSGVIQYLEKSQLWYYFLKCLHERLINCSISRNIGMYNITNLDINKKVSVTNLKAFLQKDSREELYYQYNDVREISLDISKVKTLQEISTLASQHRKTNPSCSSNHSTINPTRTVDDDLYDTRGYLNEFYELESKDSRNSVSSLTHYQSLMNRVELYIAKNKNDADTLNYLHVAIFSRICNIKNDLNNYVVVDINGYFSLVKKHLEQYNRALREVRIDTHKVEYQNIINAQIGEANKLIQESIVPDINKIYNDIHDQIHALIKDMMKLARKTEQEKVELLKKRNELKEKLPLMAILGVLKVSSMFLCFLGPAGTVASAVVGLSIDVAGSYVSKESSEVSKLLNEAKNTNEQLTDYCENKQQILKNNLNHEKINSSSQELIENDKEFERIFIKVNSLKKENVSNDEKKNTKKDVVEYYNKLSNEKEKLSKEIKTEKSQDDNKIDRKLKWLKAVDIGISVASVGMETLGDYGKVETGVSELDEIIELVEKKTIQIKQYEEDLRNIVVPVMENIEKTLFEQVQKSANQSQVTLDINKWKLQNFFRDFKANMEYMIQVPSNPFLKETIMGCIDKLQNGMLTVFQIYDRIQEYQGQVRLADYMAKLNSEPTLSQNHNFDEEIHKLELKIKSNLVLFEYEKAKSTFAQYVFPFIKSYTLIDLPSNLTSKDASALVSYAQREINELEDQLIRKYTTVGPSNGGSVHPDKIFDIKHVHLPFYTWSHTSCKQNIFALLQGQEVTMKAAITEGLEYNAVKFREIGIRFLFANETLQTEFDIQSVNFSLSLKHFGDSYYRCENDYYIFNHNLIEMQRSINTMNDTLDKIYFDFDETYAKIQNNTALFSPYATWKMMLMPRYKKNHFDELKKFTDHVINITLVGRGSYVDSPTQVCANNLEKYYERAKITSQSRKRRNAPNYFDNTENGSPQVVQFVSSSANQIESPINMAINLLSGVLKQMNPFYTPSVMNYDLIKSSIRCMFKDVIQFSISTAKYFVKPTNFISTATFNINESLVLADFITRWLTKTKLYCNTREQPMNLFHVRALALNIIENFEETLQRDFPDKCLTFDPIVLMSKLEKEIINNDYVEIEKVLHQLVDDQ